VWVVTGCVCMDDDSMPIDPEYRIGDHEVAVPTHCYKVVLCEDDQGEFTMYAFMMPNHAEPVPRPSTDYQLTVDRLEEITGYDYFPELEDEVEEELEGGTSEGWGDE